jgi:HEAT repeat protein
MIRAAARAALCLCLVASVAAEEDAEDRKTREKMLKDGAKKMASAKQEDREEGSGWLLGYLTCEHKSYVPILQKALKDTSPEVRRNAAQSLEKLQATEAIPDLIALLDDPVEDVRVRAGYAIGGMGKAAASAEPALKKAKQKAAAAHDDMMDGTLENALDEIHGKPANRYKCP